MIDVQSIIAKQLILDGVAGGNVIIADGIQEFESPAVFISISSVTGNRNDGLFGITITAACIANSEYEALNLSEDVVNVLDGWGGEGISGVYHISTIPQRTEETTPVTHTYVVSLRAVYQRR